MCCTVAPLRRKVFHSQVADLMYSKFLELVEKMKIKEEQQEPKAPPLNDQDWCLWLLFFLTPSSMIVT